MQHITLGTLLRHLFDRRWVAASFHSANPQPTTFLGALVDCLLDGGEIVLLPQ